MFCVTEEVVYRTVLSTSELPQFILKRVPALKLVEKNVLTEENLKTMREMVRRGEKVNALRALENLNINESSLNAWIAGSSIDSESLIPADVAALAKDIVAIKATQQESRRVIAVHNEHMQKVFTNQERLRANIKSLEKVANGATLIGRYLKDLNAEEDDLIKTRAEVEKLEKDIAAAEAKLQGLQQQLAKAAKAANDKL